MACLSPTSARFLRFRSSPILHPSTPESPWSSARTGQPRRSFSEGGPTAHHARLETTPFCASPPNLTPSPGFPLHSIRTVLVAFSLVPFRNGASPEGPAGSPSSLILCQKYVKRPRQFARVLEIQWLNQEGIRSKVVSLIHVANVVGIRQHDHA